ncbi:MAG: Stk1 family PASTA domain-containing Ser/Thr kinase [Firmicutes bacterium]|nr:Stk1 family PASTA domain-containing Ser/Thr kinase [Bacillota bacterium]
MIEKGQKINDRYEIIKSIGEGGMANVYLAYDTILDRRVAIKLLRGDLSGDEKFVRRFQREALSASSLSHPNIVEMYDVGEDNGLYYIVMEYIEGKTLKQLIKKRGSITLSEAIDIMLQLTDGISHAHDSYIIHRDLKPQNIMIREDGSIKITDFGIAMALNSTQLTQTNSVMGSVHYLPPEQASGKGSTIRSDIYSMGILFYELITGQLPFKGDNAVEIALKQMRDEIPSIRKLNPAIPQSVENVIIKASAKNPKNRYTDAKEMHADLLTVLNDERTEEKKIVFKYPEHEIEDGNTKNIVTVKKKTEEKVKEIKEENNEIEELDDLTEENQIIEDKTLKRTSRVVWVLASLFTILVIGVASVVLILPYVHKTPDVKVPSVVNLTVIEAEQKLKEAGFEVAIETKKEENKNIEVGKVIKTSPSEGRTVKKGTTITLYESIGQATYEVEDFTGKNYIEVQTLLEQVHGLEVTIEKKLVDDPDAYELQEVIGQSVEKGTVLSPGASITLYIPDIDDGYPNMVEDGWTVDDVEAFCEKYNLRLTIEYLPTAQYTEGTLISQSRSPKTPIISGATLKVVVTKLPEPEPTPTPEETPEPTPTPEAEQ